jgi:DNA-binding HxlR family transcriptional regulator
MENVTILRQARAVTLFETADEMLRTKNGLKILTEIAKGKKRFNELQRIFGSSATLTTRLRELEQLQLIGRVMEIQEDNPARRKPAIIRYAVTPKGAKVARLYEQFKISLSELLRKP